MANKKILILTPDGVGSTLLQRTLCAWGNLREVWINPHELTNGLVNTKGWLQKDWELGYSQSLNDIIKLIAADNHHLIVRLAHYHILNRKDSTVDLEKFYNFLLENFIIVSCHRRNTLDYAMSWSIRELKKTQNVYSFSQKFNIHPHGDKFELNIKFFTEKLNNYLEYERWLSDNFLIDSKFYYEDLRDIDNFVADLVGGNSKDFKNKFDLSVADYCFLSATNKNQIDQLGRNTGLKLVVFLKYFQSIVDKGYMPNSIPLKMNSFATKIRKTENFEDILFAYNHWAKQTNEYQPLDSDTLNKLIAMDPFNDF